MGLLAELFGSCFRGAASASSTQHAALPSLKVRPSVEEPSKPKAIAAKTSHELAFSEDVASLPIKHLDIFASMRSDASACNSTIALGYLAPGSWSGGGQSANEAATICYTSCPELIFLHALEEELAAEEGCKASRTQPQLQGPPASLLDALRSHRVSPCSSRISSADSRNRSSQRSPGRPTYMFGPRLADSRSLHLIMSCNTRQGRQRSAQVRPVSSAHR